MEDNNKERVEIQIKYKETYTIDLEDKKFIIFTGDVGRLTNLIPQTIIDARKKWIDKKVSEYEGKESNFVVRYFPGDSNQYKFPKDAVFDCSLDGIEDRLGKPDSKITSYLYGYYDFYKNIEARLSPSEQIEFIDNLFGKFENWKTIYLYRVLISTHSPYILNYMNVIMARDQEFARKISAYYVDSEYGHIHCLDSTCNLTNRRILNTIDLSDPMEYIFEKYDEIK